MGLFGEILMSFAGFRLSKWLICREHGSFLARGSELTHIFNGERCRYVHAGQGCLYHVQTGSARLSHC